MPDSAAFLSAIELQRPHFLDQDQRYLFPGEGNRAVLFSFVTQDATHRFTGEMERQIFWWKKNRFPKMEDFAELSALDGILIDVARSDAEIVMWQDRFAEHADVGAATQLLQDRLGEVHARHCCDRVRLPSAA